MIYQGIIFDFNGVLWWDNQLQEDSWNSFAKQFQVRPFQGEEMEHHVHGRNMSHTLSYLAGHKLSQFEIEALGEQKESIYRQMCLDQGQNFRLSPGAVDLLDFIAHHGIRRTIATASAKENLDFFIQHLHLDRWFQSDQIVYDDGSAPGKPAPDYYQKAAHNLRLAPFQCVVIEDSVSGLEAAHTAGIGHIVAVSPAERHESLSGVVGVDVVIENLGQLPKEQLFLGEVKQIGTG